MTSKIEKYRQLVFKLHDFTKRRKLQWECDQKGRVAFTPLGNQTINIYLSENKDYEPIVKIEIKDLSGAVKDSFTDETVNSGEAFRFDGAIYTSYYYLFEQIRDMAIRQATGADEAIDDLLSNLDRLDDDF